MQQPWFAAYPQGVEHTIADQGDTSIVDIFDASCERFGADIAYTNMGARLSYRELHWQAGQFAAFLHHQLGLTKGERVALMMPNLLQYPIALFGILQAGLVAVNVNPMYTASELHHQLADAGVRAIVIIENFAATLTQVIDQLSIDTVITTRIGDRLPPLKRILTNAVVKHVKKLVPAFSLPGAINFNTALAQGARLPATTVPVHADDLAFLQYTGGTTGAAKGAMLLHRNIVANMAQCQAWLAATTQPGNERIITALPLYHVFALTANCLVFLQLGGNNALVTNPRDIPGLVKTFARHRPTAFTGVNTLFNALIDNAEFQQLDFSALRLTLGGGAAVQRTVAQKWKAITGVPLIEAYGLTETSPAAIINPLDLADYNGAIGLPIPSTNAAIRDDAGHDLHPGETGELCIAGPQVMPGYWQQPQANVDSFCADGHFRTGDIARMDENGFFHIVDRKKDMILVSGFNVFPNEVEDVAARCPGVHEVACIGVPSAKSGEAVKLFVVKAAGANVTADDIINHCRQNLTRYKVPKQIEFTASLPKSNVGKILRKALRDKQLHDKT